jgi:hypothetical protein
MRSKFPARMFVALLLALVLLAVPLVAFADDLSVDSDLLTTTKGNAAVVLTAAPGAVVNMSAQLIIERGHGANHLTPGTVVTVVADPSADYGNRSLPPASTASQVSIAIPSPWTTKGEIVSGISNVSFAAPTTTGTYSYAVIWKTTADYGNNLKKSVKLLIDLTVAIPPDTTAPATTSHLSPEPNANGWHKDNVTVNLTATDNEYGSGVNQVVYSATGAQHIPASTVDSPSASVDITAEGITTVSYYAVDNNGNIEAAKTVIVRIDKTAPTISGAAMTSPDGNNGWYKSNVVVHFTGTDTGSGIDTVSTDTTLMADGVGQSVLGTATDLAGNSATDTVSGINIDKTPPTITSSRNTEPNSYGWNNTNVTVSFSATDSLSGLDTWSSPTTFSDEGANQSVTGTATDQAGNTASLLVDQINIDKGYPSADGHTTTTPDANGWYRHDVTVHFSGWDDLSGIGSVTPDTIISTEGQGQWVSGTVTDKAGNTVSTSVFGISIDKTKPTISIAQPIDGAVYTLGQVVQADFSASDETSGIDSLVGTVPNGSNIDTSSVGTKSFTVVATDWAGNEYTTSVSYTVV